MQTLRLPVLRWRDRSIELRDFAIESHVAAAAARRPRPAERMQVLCCNFNDPAQMLDSLLAIETSDDVAVEWRDVAAGIEVQRAVVHYVAPRRDPASGVVETVSMLLALVDSAKA